MTCSKLTGRFTRFINDDDKIDDDGRVKPNTFHPSRKEKDHISVFLTENLDESDIWCLGLENIIPELAGRADLDACDVYEIGLCIKIDDDSNGHANMFPFPDVTSGSSKERRAKYKERSRISAQLVDISNTKSYFPP